MIKLIGGALVLVILLPGFAFPQEPKAKPPVLKPLPARIPPSAQKIPQVALPEAGKTTMKAGVTAQLKQGLPHAQTVRIGSTTWTCHGRTCVTPRLPTRAVPVDACHALRKKVGSIVAFGDGERRLSPAELIECNRASLNRPPGPVVLGDGLPGRRLPGAQPGERVPLEGDAPPMIGGVDLPDGTAGEIPERPKLHPLPELAIIDVRRASMDPLAFNEAVSVGVVVQNTGDAAATVRAGRIGDIREGVLILFGATRTINPGQTVNLPLVLVARGGFIKGDQLETEVLLFNPPRPGDTALGQRFRDRNNADNEFMARFPVDVPRRFNLVATLDEIRIMDDCDNVSAGDWIVNFAFVEIRGTAITKSDATFWPSETRSANVDTRSTEPVNRTLRLTSVAEESTIRVEVSAIDCDDDSPVVWPTTGIPLGHRARGVACDGEELFEASGANDNVGLQFFELSPTEWQGTLPSTLSMTAHTGNECSDRPAFVPRIRLEVDPL